MVWGVQRTNTYLPNTYRRSSTATIYPHFGIDFLQPPRFLNSKDSETVRLDHFQSFPFLSTEHHSDFQQENVFHHHSVGIHIAMVTCISFLLVDLFKICRKASYSYDHVRIVIFLIRASRIFYLSTSDRISTFCINTVEKNIRENTSYTACPSTVLRISNDFLIRKTILYFKYMDFSTPYRSLP